MKAHVRSDWQRALLICRKCGKKLGGGFGEKGKTSLSKALRKETGGGKKRKAPLGIVEVGCLGVCPRGAVTMIDTSRPGEWLLIREGSDVDEVVEKLGL